MAKRVQESAEDYLETILILKQNTGFVRSIDIARQMNFSKPSISRAVSKLREDGYITMSPGGEIEMTATGLALAERIYTRHRVLTDFLISLGVTPEVAADEACRIEHHLSDDTFEKIRAHYMI
jgi:Mn-dependent DtxR family transcriptional regulator